MNGRQATQVTGQLFLDLVRQALHGESAAAVVSSYQADIDWRSLYRLTEAHGLMAFLGIRLRPTGFAGLPQWFADRLEQHARVNSLRNRMLVEEYQILCHAFKAAGIPVVALKGIGYLRSVYDDPGLRELADIDFLVDERQLHAACRIIESRGYHALSMADIGEPGPDSLPAAQRQVYESFYHAYSFQSADDLINVDLHWRLAPATFANSLPAELALDAARAMDGAEAGILPAAMQFVCQCQHAAKDGWSELKWAIDIHYIANQLDDASWDEAWQIASRLRARRMLLTGLAISAWLTGSNPSVNRLWSESRFRPGPGTLRNIQKRLLDDPDRKYRLVPCLGLNKTYMSLCDTQTDALTHAWRKLTLAEPEDFSRLGLTSRLLPIWPVLRPFLLSASCFRRAIRHLGSRSALHG